MMDFWQNVFSLAIKYRSVYLSGALWTLIISVIGTVLGLFIGLLVGVLRTIPLSRKSAGKNFCLKSMQIVLSIYIDFFRSTPMMVQAMVFYYGLAGMGVQIPRILAGIIVVSVNTGAYMSEIVRGGIVSIEKGQFEAARSVGMNHWQTMKLIVMPQVLRNILPATANEFIVNIKDTAVLSVISVSELFFQTKSVVGNNFMYAEGYTVTIFIYLLMTLSIVYLLRTVERKIDGPKDFKLVANQMQLLNSDDILEQNKIV